MLEKLKQEFIISDEMVRLQLESLLSKTIQYCKVDARGRVHLAPKATRLGARDKIGLILIARKLASELEEKISPVVSVAELADMTGLAENQVRARTGELIRDRVADSPSRGNFQALQHRIEQSLDDLAHKLDGR